MTPFEHRRRGAEKAGRDGYAYTTAGIILDDLLPEAERPRTLFEAPRPSETG